MTKNLDNLAFCIFKLFTQYEYALKAMGYALSGSGGQAEPGWDRFSNELGRLVWENFVYYTKKWNIYLS